jgi:GPI mannosyltransferase 3
MAIKTRNNNFDWWRGIYLLALVGLILRILVAFATDNIYHPDELFQYLEQAHRVVFGYGYIPWEYRFGTRSWVLPGLISLLLLLCKILNFDYPGFYIPLVKVFLCVISVSLVFSSYVIGRNLGSEKAGRLACFLTCFWYELIYFAHKPLPDMLSAYLFAGALACIVVKMTHSNPLLFGFLAALSIVIRPQHLPAVAVLIIYAWLVYERKQLIKAGAAFLFIIIYAGCIDILTWGGFLISYYNNYLFNRVYGVSNYFGTEPFTWYIAALLISSAGILVAPLVFSFTKFHKVWLPLVCVSTMLLSYSLIPHKEYRFVFVVIPLLLIIVAILVTVAFLDQMYTLRRNIALSFMLLSFLSISILGLFYRLPNQSSVYSISPLADQDNLKAYSFLAEEPDVAGILDITQPRWRTGGYYYLHRDVPIYFPHHLITESSRTHELASYVSHIVCTSTMKNISGFKPVKNIGDIEIRKQINPPLQYKRPDFYTREIFFSQVDGKYIPTVRRNF